MRCFSSTHSDPIQCADPLHREASCPGTQCLLLLMKLEDSAGELGTAVHACVLMHSGGLRQEDCKLKPKLSNLAT